MRVFGLTAVTGKARERSQKPSQKPEGATRYPIQLFLAPFKCKAGWVKAKAGWALTGIYCASPHKYCASTTAVPPATRPTVPHTVPTPLYHTVLHTVPAVAYATVSITILHIILCPTLFYCEYAHEES